MLGDWNVCYASSLLMKSTDQTFHKTVSAFGLEFFSSLESGFSGALHLQFTVELVLQYLSDGVLHHHFDNEGRYIKTNTYLPYTMTRHFKYIYMSLLHGYEDLPCDGCCKTSSYVNWR